MTSIWGVTRCLMALSVASVAETGTAKQNNVGTRHGQQCGRRFHVDHAEAGARGRWWMETCCSPLRA